MNEEVLDTETVVLRPEERQLRVVTDQEGARHILVGAEAVASDALVEIGKLARLVLRIPLRTAKVAWIGGGLCVGPRLARGRVQAQDVYELRPALSRFCPKDATFVPGDWRTTLTGTYDVIVYDIGDEPDRALLESHLQPGGSLLGVE